MNLISIGRFSRLTGLSIRALRLYNTEGILQPSRIDTGTGYRYYLIEQVELAERIKMLRECEMSLDHILAILQNPEETTQRLLEHREYIEQRLTAHKKMLGKLDIIIYQTNKPFEVTYRQSVAQHLICRSESIIWAETNQRFLIGKVMGEVFYYVRANQIAHSGALFCTYPVPWRKRLIELRACIPVLEKHQTSAPFEYLELAPVKLACTIHAGDYITLPQTLEKLTTWVENTNYEIIGDVRETYIEHPLTTTEPSEYRTEIAVPIRLR